MKNSMNTVQVKKQCWWADRGTDGLVGSGNSISMNAPEHEAPQSSREHPADWATDLQRPIGTVGWVPAGAAEELTRGPKSRTGLLAGADEALKGRAGVAARARAWQPESQGPSTPQCLMTSQARQPQPSLSLPTCQLELRISVFLAGPSYGRSTGLFFVN